MLPLRLLAPLLRIFFRLLYYEFAWSYDWVAWLVSAGRWQSWVHSIMPHLRGGRLLELGHGPGHLQAALADNHKFVIGVDRSPYMSRQAARRLRQAGHQPRLVNSYAQSMPFPQAAFEIVFSTFPSEYITHPETLAEVFRLLAPGGRLVVLPGAWITGKSLTERLAAALFRLTGQSPPQDISEATQPFLERLEKVGFSAQSWTETTPSGVLLFIAGEKPQD